MGQVVLFTRTAVKNSDWRADEWKIIRQIGAALNSRRSKIEITKGTTDEGEPWVAFSQTNILDPVFHLTRNNRSYVMINTSSMRAMKFTTLTDILKSLYSFNILRA